MFAFSCAGFGLACLSETLATKLHYNGYNTLAQLPSKLFLPDTTLYAIVGGSLGAALLAAGGFYFMGGAPPAEKKKKRALPG